MVQMYKLCKTEQSALRQRELEQGLLSAMCAHRYEEISVSDLCDQLNIPRKSFYRYFSSKDGALHALIDHTLLEYETFHSVGRAEDRSSYQAELEHFFRFWQERRALLDALDRSGISGVLVTRSIDHALSDVGVPLSALHHSDKNVSRHAVMFCVCGMMSMVLNWHKAGFDLAISQIAAIAVELVTRPLFTSGK